MARILVIDDEAPLRLNLVRFLRLEGHQVAEASDGEAGLMSMRHYPPDLIFCDLMMPRMNGMDLLATLHSDAILKGIPFFFISASAEPEWLEESLRLGASGYLTKPFSLSQINAILSAHLGH